MVNFAGLLTDFGPQKTVKSLREIHQVELLSPELYLSQTMRSRKVTLEEGDMPESSEEEDESVNFTNKITQLSAFILCYEISKIIKLIWFEYWKIGDLKFYFKRFL